MKFKFAWILVLWIASSVPASAQELVSGFAGSELLGEYETDFDRLLVAETEDGAPLALEGRLKARVFRKPADKSGLEVLRSYRDQLSQAGFDIVFEQAKGAGSIQNRMRQIYRDGNHFDDRPYTLDGARAFGDISYLATFVDSYLLARKTFEDEIVHVVVLVGSKKDVYAVDILRSEAMETGTVTLSPELLREKIASDGKVAIYDIHFDTNSASIRPDSKAALATIAQFVGSNAAMRFYVVGHTDDTGAFDHNLRLSSDRAAAVVQALVTGHGANAERIVSHGVGPLAPVGSNDSDRGRELNRRVELVLRLKN